MRSNNDNRNINLANLPLTYQQILKVSFMCGNTLVHFKLFRTLQSSTIKIDVGLYHGLLCGTVHVFKLKLLLRL